jgi:hypothetical protein
VRGVSRVRRAGAGELVADARFAGFAGRGAGAGGGVVFRECRRRRSAERCDGAQAVRCFSEYEVSRSTPTERSLRRMSIASSAGREPQQTLGIFALRAPGSRPVARLVWTTKRTRPPSPQSCARFPRGASACPPQHSRRRETAHALGCSLVNVSYAVRQLGQAARCARDSSACAGVARPAARLANLDAYHGHQSPARYATSLRLIAVVARSNSREYWRCVMSRAAITSSGVRPSR